MPVCQGAPARPGHAWQIRRGRPLPGPDGRHVACATAAAPVAGPLRYHKGINHCFLWLGTAIFGLLISLALRSSCIRRRPLLNTLRRDGIGRPRLGGLCSSWFTLCCSLCVDSPISLNLPGRNPASAFRRAGRVGCSLWVWGVQTCRNAGIAGCAAHSANSHGPPFLSALMSLLCKSSSIARAAFTLRTPASRSEELTRSLSPWASGFAICCADYLQLPLLLLLMPVLRDLCLFPYLLCAIYIASYDVSCAGCHKVPVRLTCIRRSKHEFCRLASLAKRCHLIKYEQEECQ